MIKLSRKVKWWCAGCLKGDAGWCLIIKGVVRLELRVAWVGWQQTAHLQGKQSARMEADIEESSMRAGADDEFKEAEGM